MAGAQGQSSERRLSISLGKHATVCQAEVCGILASVYEIQTRVRPEKYVSICSDNQVALKAQQCQKVLNGISTWPTVGLYWVPGHAGVRGNKIAIKLARGSSVQKLKEQGSPNLL